MILRLPAVEAQPVIRMLGLRSRDPWHALWYVQYIRVGSFAGRWAEVWKRISIRKLNTFKFPTWSPKNSKFTPILKLEYGEHAHVST